MLKSIKIRWQNKVIYETKDDIIVRNTIKSIINFLFNISL